MARSDRYFFDKRDWKRRIIKYIVSIAISFVPTLLFNIYVGNKLGSDWLVILIDCVILLIVFAITNLLLNRYFEKRDDKMARIRKEREELEARKKKILEDSYKKKRLEKERSKKEKLESDKVNQSSDDTQVEIIEPQRKKSRKK